MLCDKDIQRMWSNRLYRIIGGLVWIANIVSCGEDGTGIPTETSNSTTHDPPPGTGTSNTGTGGDESTTEDPNTPLLTVDEMFSLTRLPEFHITLDQAAMDALFEDPKTYVQGIFRYNEFVYAPVGIRLKGNISLTTLDEKPSFKIKLNEYVSGQKFLGLKKLTFHNMHQDASMMHERLGYEVFRTMGVPSPRTGYAKIVVNDIPYGLYLNVEAPDDVFLAHNFADPTGNLYEGEHGDDIHKDPDGWEQDEGKDTSREDLIALAEQAKMDGDGLFYAPDAMLDTPRILAYLASEAFVGHFDGYWVSHNFFLYHELASAKWTLMPWSLDQTFVRRVDAFDGGGFIKRKCFEEQRCLIDYIHTASWMTDTLEAADLPGQMDSVLRLIDETAHLDARKRHSNETMESSQKSLRKWVEARPQAVRERVDCLINGVEPDLDQDGYGGCFKDCNDMDPNVNPEVAEICDGVDNDCSGFADDIAACECPSATFEGVPFYFCTHEFDWRKAERFCASQGHQLAKFDSRSQNDLVSAHARTVMKSRWAIGINDRDEENVYVWTDGTIPAYSAWAPGEPAHRLDWFDCGFFTSAGKGEWQELNCVQSEPFVCR